MTGYLSKEKVDERTSDNEARRIEPNMVSMHKLQHGYLLREGDVVYVNRWKDFQKVSNNVHSDERYNLPEDHRDRSLALVPIRCHKTRNGEEPDELEGTHLLAVSNRNARNFSRLLMDAEHGEAFIEKGSSWITEEASEEDNSEDETELSCPFCGKQYKSEHYFKEHVADCNDG